MLVEAMGGDKQKGEEAIITAIRVEIPMKTDGMVVASQTTNKIITDK